MTHRKITVCAFVKGSSPQEHDHKKHDWRPTECRKKNCFGKLLDCESRQDYVITGNRDNVRRMLTYLRTLKRKEMEHKEKEDKERHHKKD